MSSALDHIIRQLVDQTAALGLPAIQKLVLLSGALIRLERLQISITSFRQLVSPDRGIGTASGSRTFSFVGAHQLEHLLLLASFVSSSTQIGAIGTARDQKLFLPSAHIGSSVFSSRSHHSSARRPDRGIGTASKSRTFSSVGAHELEHLRPLALFVSSATQIGTIRTAITTHSSSSNNVDSRLEISGA